MRRHLTLLTTTEYARNQSDTVEATTELARAINDATGVVGPVRTRPRLRLANASDWSHTLVLTGKLDQRSAPELEEEIECLCEEGVTELTLDLRRLDAIDSSGVAVIASRSAVCKSRGRDFAVIPGSRVVQRALVDGGAAELLEPHPSEGTVHHFPCRSLSGPLTDRATATITNL